MASEAVTPPPSTLVRTSSTASSAPGIFRSASWARIRSRREPAAFTEHLRPPGHTLPAADVPRRYGEVQPWPASSPRAAVPRIGMGARPRAAAGLARARSDRRAAPSGCHAYGRWPRDRASVVFQFVSVDFTKLFHELVRSLFELVHYCRRELRPGKGPVEPYVSVKLATVTLSCSSELIHKIPRPCIGII